MDEELKRALNKIYQSTKESEYKTAGFSFMAIGLALTGGGLVNSYTWGGLCESIIGIYLFYGLEKDSEKMNLWE